MQSYRFIYLLVFIGLILLNGCDSSSNDTEDAIIVQDIAVGEGDEVYPGHTIIVGYVGKLEDGTVFDQSEAEDDNLIFTLGVNNVIRGLDEGIPGMKIGGVRQIEIPASKAFGKNGMCTSAGDCPVPPNATVTFVITLVDILDYVITKDLLIGVGDSAISGSLVEIEFVGVLQNGQIFSSSQASGPMSLVLGDGVGIQGLHEGILGMKPGGVRLMTIPPVLGYGAQGDPFGSVPPYAVLEYRIELLRIGS